MIDALTEKRHWDRNWRTSTFSNLCYRANLRWVRTYLYRKMDNIFMASLPIGTQTFFEIGCGGGKWLVYFGKRFGYRVSGVDYSERGVSEARSCVSLAGVEAHVVHGDVFSVQVKDRYDVVLSDGFLEHFDNTAETLSFMATFVRKGGHLITIVPNLTGLHRFFLSLFKHDKEVLEIHKVVTKKKLIRAYEASGFGKIGFYEIGSVIPKTFALPRIITKILDVLLRAAAFVGINIEDEKISSTYLVVGRRREVDTA